jgi:hypothetical protein
VFISTLTISCLFPRSAHIDGHIAKRADDEIISRTNNDTVVVAVCFSTTTRGLSIKGLNDLAMTQYLLPSLLKTAEQKYEYWLYILFDQGDQYFDAGGKAQLVEHMKGAFHAPLAIKGISSKSVLLRFDNPFKKPGPAFNFMMGAAGTDGADYLYRVNDDTEVGGQGVGSGWAAVGVGSGPFSSHCLVPHPSFFSSLTPPSIVSTSTAQGCLVVRCHWLAPQLQPA